MKTLRLLSLLLIAFLLSPAANAAKITIVNMDGPNEGFNDPTRVKRIGGNPGRTLGEQRLIAFQFAADIWGAVLDSNVEIRIQASFDPLSCTATSAVLGSAGTIQIFSDFPGATYANTWYAGALANRLAGYDLSPGAPGTTADDIRARFNSALGQTGCLEGSGWYLGLDNDAPANMIDLVTVLLHEFSHGLGFANYVDYTNGTEIRGQTDIYSRQLLDLTTNKTWNEMSAAQRKASAINARNVVWTGPEAVGYVSSVLQLGTPMLYETAPTAASFQVGTATFGPPLTATGVSGQVALALDNAGLSSTDACEAITNTIAGKIALVDRGNCTFVVKAANVQAAGAIGMIVADNVAGSPPSGMSGTSTAITIPSVRITQADGTTLKSLVGSLYVSMKLDMSLRAGADLDRRPYVWTPDPVQPGSSISHWDVLATPNQLMEPFINSDLTHNVQPPYDLTLPLLHDLGW